jgi:hypothetical protein
VSGPPRRTIEANGWSMGCGDFLGFSALIETPDTWTQFAVSFSNCTPRPVAKP